MHKESNATPQISPQEIDMRDNIIAFIKDYFQMHSEEITGDSKLRADLGLSSFELLEMYCSMEEAFGLDINESEYHKFFKISTINDIAMRLCNSAIQKPDSDPNINPLSNTNPSIL